MNESLFPVLIIVAAYLLGSIPFGLLLAKWIAGVDVREVGSRNIGATNVARSAGKALGVLTLLLDAAKGAGPTAAALYLFEMPIAVVSAAGLCAIIGHVFPVYLRFKGGKGVATAAGVFLVVAPLPTLIAFSVFLVLFLITRITSIGSMASSMALAVAIYFLDGRLEPLLLAVAVLVLVLVRHRENIKRLFRRTERGI